MISYHKSLVKIAWEESRTTAHGTHTKLNPYQNQYGLNLINFTERVQRTKCGESPKDKTLGSKVIQNVLRHFFGGFDGLLRNIKDGIARSDP